MIGNPYLLLAAVLAWGASVGAAGWWAYGAGRDAETATQYREQQAAEKSAQAAARAAAQAIAKIEVRHVTVRQELEREVQTREVFRECRSGDAAVQLLNAAVGAAGPAASAPGRGELSAADAAR